MRAFQLSTLGHVNLTDASGHPVPTLLAQPKRLALLIYLAVEASHRFVRRETLCELFWPDADSERARASLRQALAFVRRTLGDAAIRARGDDEVGLDADVVCCDATVLLAGPVTRELIAAYGGEFLRDFVVMDVPRFERWVEDTRSGLARDAGHAAMTLAESALRTAGTDDEFRQSVLDARRATEIVPADERALVLLLQALSASGDRSGAERGFGHFVERLARDFDAEPAAETVQAMERLRAGWGAATGTATATASATATLTAPVATTTTAPAPATSTDAATTEAQRDEGEVVGVVARDTDVGVGFFESGKQEGRAGSGMVESVRRRGGVRSRGDYARWMLVGVVAALALFAVRQRADSVDATGRASSATSELPRVRRLLVAPFANQTGDAALDPFGRMLADWITEGFSRVDELTVVPGTALMVMQRTPDRSLASMAEETGATMIVSGSYYRTGGTLHVQARLTDATLTKLLRPAETVSVPADSAMMAIARLRVRLMAAVAPLLDTTTHLRYASPPPSYEAYREYLAGFSRFIDGDHQAALSLFQRAASTDSSYYMPRLAAAIVQSNLGDIDAAFVELQQLQNQREVFGPVEQGTLDMLSGLLRGDLSFVYRSVSRVARITPVSINEYMVAETARRLNRPAEALGILRAMGAERGELRGWRAYWRELAFAQHMLGDLQGALTSARVARARYPADRASASAEIRALAALGFEDSVIQVIESVRGRSAAWESQVGPLYRAAAEEMMSRGLSDESRASLDYRTRAMRLAERATSWYAEQNDDVLHGGYVRSLLMLNRLNEAAAVASQQQLRPNIDDTPRYELIPSTLADLGDSPLDEKLRARDLGVIAARQGAREQAMVWDAQLMQMQASLSEAQRGTRWASLQLDRVAILAQLGETDRAMNMLREATANGLAFWPGLLADPHLAPLRRHPAWASFATPAG